jgi:hypothetical protein
LLDWTQGNGLHYLEEDGSLLFSLRHRNWVLKLDHTTGDVLWKVGTGGDFGLLLGDWFFAKDVPSLDEIGRIVLYGNGNERSEGLFSRAVRYQFDEEEWLARQDWVYETTYYRHVSGPKTRLVDTDDYGADLFLSLMLVCLLVEIVRSVLQISVEGLCHLFCLDVLVESTGGDQESVPTLGPH